MKLPKLITTTKEGRRIYPIKLVVNNRQLNEVHIDPHYEEKHPYMNDEKIYEIVQVLNNRSFIPQDRQGSWEYFVSEPVLYRGRNYRLVWCLEDNSSFIGVRNCFYRKKYDQKK